MVRTHHSFPWVRRRRTKMNIGKENMVWLLFLIWITAASGKTLFTLPILMEADSTAQACLILQDVARDNGWVDEDGQSNMFTISVSINYTTINQVEDFKFAISSMDYHSCFLIKSPQVPGEMDIVVDVSVSYQTTAGLDTTKNLLLYLGKVTSRVTPLITLIQTDKPIYKPGQTVKFRVMTMDYKLAAKTDDYSLITIETPNGLRVKQWKDVAPSSGLVSLEMPLSSDPVLGGWKIKATYEGEDTEQVFTVDEYVLPKFEVTITPPSYFLPSSKIISGKVCAKYTYGKPVKGELKIHICYKPRYYYYQEEERPCGNIITKIDGCSEFFLNASVIELKNRNFSSYGDLIITANVTEEQTGIMLSESSTGPSMTMVPLTMRIEDDSNGQFKPGFPYKARIIVTNPDGSASPGETLLVTANARRSGYEWNNTFITDEDGIVYFALSDLVKGIGQVNIRVTTEVYGDDWRFLDDPRYHRTYPPSANHRIIEWYSASDNFIYIPDVDEAAECDTTVALDVYFTAEPGNDYTFLSVIRAGDNVVDSDKTEIKASDVAFILDIPSDDKYEPLIRTEVEVPPFPEFGIPPLPRHPPRLPPPPRALEAKDDSDVYPVEEELIEPVHVEPLGKKEVPEYQPKKRLAHFKLNIPVYQNYSPNVKLLLMYMRDDGEVIASSSQFNVNGCFMNKAKLSFAESTVRPGETVDYTLSASSGSTCFVGMVDKSVVLLGGNNQLAPKDVFERVGRLARTYFYYSTYQEDEEYCQKKMNKNEESEFYSSWLRPEGEDSMTAFRDVRMAVITDGQVQTRPCKEQPRYYYSVAREWAPGSGGQVPLAVPLSNEVNIVSQPEANKAGSQEVEKIRSFFPETWLWDIVTLGEDEKELTVPTTIPDTITEWVGNTLCTNPDDGVGVSDIIGVTAFQPFFVSLTLPYSAVRGETLPVVVTVFNYLSECIPMELSFSELEGFQFREAGSQSRQFCLCGGDSESYKFYIIPTVVGEIDIEVTAVSVDNVDLCTDVKLSDLGVGVTDGVQRQLLIEAEGVPEELTWSSYICLTEGSIETKQAEWTLPQDLVPDSFRATVSVVGDIMGPTLSNLKNLLRMPYGCGEQNMASWAPNIYVLQYLSNTKQLTPETEAEAKNYMSVGYQRQMNYRHVDNSYSAWGENSYNNATGSLWLTAFVVKSMAQSSDFIIVDTQDIINSAMWLANKQDDDGCFPTYGKVFSSYMKGGLADGENLAGLTAFTLIALLEANLGDEFEPSINGGFECLDMSDVTTTDTYTLSVMLYAYTLRHDVEQSRRSEVLNEVMKRKVASSGMVHWKREETEEKKEETNAWYWYRAPSAEVEMTAYVLLSLLEGSDVDADKYAIVQWLTKQRNPYGGFSSTQDTVVALQALANFGQQTFSGETAVTVEIKNSASENMFVVTPDNSLLTQSYELSGDENEVEITVTGSGCVLAQVNMKYNVYKEEDTGPAFEVKVGTYRSRTERNNCAMRTLSVCARYLKSAVSNMAIAEVKMPTGWIPVKNSLKELVKAGEVQKTEVDKNYVQLYFDELTNVDTCVTFEVEQDIRMNPKPALVKVYDYYETSYRVTTEYEIKTTCGTKEEIAVDNAGLDCRFVQCRDDIPRISGSMTCPVCPQAGRLDKKELTDLTCGSIAVYKAMVGRQGAYSVKIKANIREKEKHVFADFFANHKIGEQCSCPILDITDSRALIFTENNDILNEDTETITLKKGDTVIPYKRSTEGLVRKLSTKTKLCKKLERLRRSGTRRSMSKLMRLMRKHKL